MTPAPLDAAVGTFKLGGTLPIPRLGFGAMHLPGRPNGPAVNQATAVAVARRAVELGVRHLDTAAFYSHGPNRANLILRKALHPYPADLTIATKVGPCAPNRRAGRRGHTRAAAPRRRAGPAGARRRGPRSGVPAGGPACGSEHRPDR